MNSVVPGSELTKEPFRWDQRIFGLVLRLPGNVPVDMTTNTYIPSAENHPLDAMCEVTGGNPSLPLQPRLEIPQNLPNLNIHFDPVEIKGRMCILFTFQERQKTV